MAIQARTSTKDRENNALSRRTIVAGVGWATPAIAIASAVPAIAASTCASVERIGIGWTGATVSGTPSTTSPFTNTITVKPSSVAQSGPGPFPSPPAPLTITASHRYFGNTRGMAGNGAINNVGPGTPGNPDIFYEIKQQTGASANTPATANDYQEVTFTFDKPIRDLIFSIARIDQSASSNPDAMDGVSLVSAVGYTSTPPAIAGQPSTNSIVTGSGSIADPWKSQALSSESISLRGQIDVFFTPGAWVSSFTIRVANLSRKTTGISNNQQLVALRGMIGWRALC